MRYVFRLVILLLSLISTPALAQVTVTSISPPTGSSVGGDPVTIIGTNIGDAISVTIGGVSAVFTFPDTTGTTITAITPQGTSGVADVVVTSASLGPGTCAGCFTYGGGAAQGGGAPLILSVSPTFGNPAGGDAITIMGGGFTGVTGVTFGGAPGTSLVIVSDNQMTINTPAGTARAVSVVAINANGSGSCVDCFTYSSGGTLPVITDVEPPAGPVGGGTQITITGTGFTNASAVMFGAARAQSFSISGSTSITAVSPPGAGQVTIGITTPAGTGTLDFAFTYGEKNVLGSPSVQAGGSVACSFVQDGQDDTAALQAGLDSCGPIGLGAGIFNINCNGLTLHNYLPGTAIIGAGHAATTIVMNCAGGSAIKFQGQGAPKLQAFTVDRNQSPAPGSIGIQQLPLSQGSGYFFINDVISQHHETCIRLVGASYAPIWNTVVQNCSQDGFAGIASANEALQFEMNNVTSQGNGGNGFTFVGNGALGSGTGPVGNFSGLHSSNNGGYGISLGEGANFRVSGSSFNGDRAGGMIIQSTVSAPYPVQLTSDSFTNSGGRGLWIATGNTTSVSLAGVTATGNALSGVIQESPTLLQVVGGSFNNNGSASPSLGFGILIEVGYLVAAGVTAQQNASGTDIAIEPGVTNASVANSTAVIACLAATCNSGPGSGNVP